MACNSSVSRTALDALHAKLSAISVGYVPVQYNGTEYNDLLYKISENFGNNEDEKSTKKQSKVVRRQTPLVNAGYAIRVLVVSKALERFIRINTLDNNNSASDDVNVVILGCGLDMLGLWASHTFPSKVKLFEVDCQEIVHLKKNALIKSGLVEGFHSYFDQNDTNNIFTGDLKRGTTKADDTEVNVVDDKSTNYSLLSCDLRDVASLKRLFSHSSIDINKPTIVISELVLAYLGDDDCVRRLMQYISSEICVSSGSIFLAYEPVGPTYQTIDKLQQKQNTISVQSGYFINYHQLFTTKMIRGDQKKLSSLKHKIDEESKDEEDKSATMVFMPIGISCSDVRRLTRQLHGFDGPVDCCTAANVLPHMLEDNDDFQTPEIFDEHAALALHLNSYALLCAGSYTASNANLRNFLKISPWSNPDHSTNFMGYRYQKKYQEKNVIISNIEKNDEEGVRKLFKSSYIHLFEEYSSVKKLVKNALKTDLSLKANNILHTLNGMEFGNDESTSSIYLRYSENGGSFWVATEDIISNEKIDTPRRLLGCIGIRLYKGKDHISNEGETCFEINRLVIHSDYRNKGIGKLLLETAYSFATSKCISHTIKFIASTPEVLQPANFFYKASSFEQIKSENIGKMVINTYIRILK